MAGSDILRPHSDTDFNYPSSNDDDTADVEDGESTQPIPNLWLVKRLLCGSTRLFACVDSHVARLDVIA